MDVGGSGDTDIFRPEFKTHKKRSGGTRTPEFFVDVVKVNPIKSKNAKEIVAIRRTIGRIVKEDMNYKFYVPKRRHLLAVSLVDRIMHPTLIAKLQSS